MSIKNFTTSCHFQFIFQKSNLGITLLDLDGNILDANEKYLKLINSNKEDIFKKSLFEFIDNTNIEILKKSFDKLIDKKSLTFNIELKKAITKDNFLWFDVHGSSIEESEEIKYIVLFLEDITEIKKLKEENLKKEQILIQQLKLAQMGEMIDAIAHQWKQPLNIITTNLLNFTLELELKDIKLKGVGELNSEISSQIKHMVDTLDKFRGFFRPNKYRTNFNLFNIIQNTINLVKDEFIKENINIKIIGDKNLNIFGVETEFKHIILNIINNSKDAFKEQKIEDKKIVFYLKKNINIDILEIEDNAGGVPKNIVNKIFQANFTTKKKGTGIGLYMSKNIIESMNGKISVKNIKNGSKFIIEIQK